MISFDSEGWIRGSGTVCEPSPFFDDRQADTTVNLVVMHNISLPAGVFDLGSKRYPRIRIAQGIKSFFPFFY